MGVTRGDRARAAWEVNHGAEHGIPPAEAGWANPPCAKCVLCQGEDHRADGCTCGRCSPWGHSSSTPSNGYGHYCGPLTNGGR